tara:strand:- start:612 stop:1016 length:405 start_codon:yes stop_codon:yes gene_type:complete
MRNLEPIFIENSKVPVVLSKVAPLKIEALSFGWWVWSRREIGTVTRRHETIHFQQQLELLFLFQWILYVLFWVIGLFVYKFDGNKAYRENPFEREAYANDRKTKYLSETRKRYAWINYFWWVSTEGEPSRGRKK